jgi:hypothetical protein
MAIMGHSRQGIARPRASRGTMVVVMCPIAERTIELELELVKALHSYARW